MNMQTLLDLDLLLQVRGMTPGRAATILPAIMGLSSLVIGWMALARAGTRASVARIMSIISLLAGLTGIAFSVLHLARSTGAIGTGSGKLGAIVALVLSLTGTVLSASAQRRSRRSPMKV